MAVWHAMKTHDIEATKDPDDAKEEAKTSLDQSFAKSFAKLKISNVKLNKISEEYLARTMLYIAFLDRFAN